MVREAVAVDKLLFVCTGNICRSPMAVAFARSQLLGRPHEVSVSSAGLLREGVTSPRDALAAMRAHGLSLGDHRSSSLALALDAGPDLVIALARQHASVIVERDPELFLPRTFMLKELVRLVREFGPRAANQSVPEYLAAIGKGRRLSDLVGSSTAEDVEDPMGGGAVAFRKCAAEVATLVTTMVDAVWPRAPTRAP